MFMKRNYKKWATAALILAFILLLILFIFTDPREVGLLGILVVILAIYVFFATCFYLMTMILRKNKKSDSERRQLLIASTLAFIPVFLIIFNSLGAVGVVEIILIVLFEIITVFLITKRT